MKKLLWIAILIVILTPTVNAQDFTSEQLDTVTKVQLEFQKLDSMIDEKSVGEHRKEFFKTYQGLIEIYEKALKEHDKFFKSGDSKAAFMRFIPDNIVSGQKFELSFNRSWLRKFSETTRELSGDDYTRLRNMVTELKMYIVNIITPDYLDFQIKDKFYQIIRHDYK